MKAEAFDVLTGENLETARRIIAKYPHKRSAALPLLFLVQSVEGHVTESGMKDVAKLLDLTPAEVLATGSFYTMLKKRPQGDYLVSVCRNISCTHLGARRVVAALEDALGVGPGETTPDGRFSLEAAECLATCDGAPSMQINYEDFYRVTPEGAVEVVERLRRGEEVKSTRGEVVKTAKEIARETATAGLAAALAKPSEKARLAGGETPPPDMAPGHRPKVTGDTERGDTDGG
ncbi:MAG TPA: NAD(P)H-dependent oxidoreductase subunit E [Actinomycetota bacterium]|jgi:NADH-quinone oxidoreductase subunit E|nr:NAD(P)H-dependent oxidoreductase subunit E [Actinomycetota bacterium]